MNKKIPRKGYRILSIIWTLAAASVAVAVMRRLPQINVLLLGLLVVSLIAATSFWKTYKLTPEEDDTKSKQRFGGEHDE